VNNIIFGAGKISRGFLAHLLYLAGEDFVFIEKDHRLVELINERKKYRLYVFGQPQKNITIEGARAISCDDTEWATEAIAGANLVLISIGGKNLPQITPLLAAGVQRRMEKNTGEHMNIITCENWLGPADLVREEILHQINAKFVDAFDETVGISQAVVLRTAIEADEEILADDPLALNVSNHWGLPLDGSRIKGTLPKIEGINPIEPFNHLLDRKLFTYNAASATVSYLGYLKGYEILSEAIRDEYIEKTLMGVYDETGRALCKKYDLPVELQEELKTGSYEKYRDRRIVDMLERNARDPIRKLGPDDRMVGPAKLALEYGIEPANLATVIAAAIFYDHPADPIARQLKNKLNAEGIDAVLKDICGIEPAGKLAILIKQKIDELGKTGLIKERQRTR
jgi:mannitol-1-phosphate 5-dehydrogenase